MQNFNTDTSIVQCLCKIIVWSIKFKNACNNSFVNYLHRNLFCFCVMNEACVCLWHKTAQRLRKGSKTTHTGNSLYKKACLKTQASILQHHYNINTYQVTIDACIYKKKNKNRTKKSSWYNTLLRYVNSATASSWGDERGLCYVLQMNEAMFFNVFPTVHHMVFQSTANNHWSSVLKTYQILIVQHLLKEN